MIEPITDPELVATLRRELFDTVESRWHVRLDRIERDGWAAAPVGAAAHLFRQHADLLLDAVELLWCHSAYVIRLDGHDSLPEIATLEMSMNDLVAFSIRYEGVACLMVPNPATFAILFAPSHYHLIIGPRDFVQASIGESIGSARNRFNWYALGPWYPDEPAAPLVEVASRYADYK